MHFTILPFDPSTLKLDCNAATCSLESLTIKVKDHNNGNKSQPISKASELTVNNRPKQTNKVGCASVAPSNPYTSDTPEPLSILLSDQTYNPLASASMLLQGNTSSSPVFKNRPGWTESTSCLKQKLNWHLQQCINNILASDEHTIKELTGELVALPDVTNWALKLTSSSDTLLQQLRQRLFCSLLQDSRSSISHGGSLDQEKRDDEEFTAVCSPFMEAADLFTTTPPQQKALAKWTLEVSACELGPLLGGKELVKKIALLDNCSLEVCHDSSAASFLPAIDSRVWIKVCGASERDINSVRERLLNRCHDLRATTQFMHSGRIYITDGHGDWLKTGPAFAQLQEIQWQYGLSIVTEPENPNYLVVFAGSRTLLMHGLQDLQRDLLSQHQTVNLTLSNVSDLRDLQPSQETLEFIALSTGCSISLALRESCMSVDLQLSGEASSLARCLLRLAHGTGSDQLSPITALSLQMTVPAGIRDFLCGKKDGKLLRIVRDTGVHVELLEPGLPCETLVVMLSCDCSVVVGSSGLGPVSTTSKSNSVYQPPHQRASTRNTITTGLLASNLLQAKQLIEGELPAELQFHVPETHHKRMIGHGGKTIQRIMKKYGVYVKFMSDSEASALNCLEDPHTEPTATPNIANVVVRTPAKNQAALHGIRDEILMESCACEEYSHPAIDHAALRALHRLQATNRQMVELPYSLELLKAVDACAGGLEVAVKDFTSQIICEGDSQALQALKRCLLSLNLERSESKTTEITTVSSSSSSSSSPSAFKHFPSALFVESDGCAYNAPSPRLSPSWSQLLLELDSRNQTSAVCSSASDELISPSLSIASSVSMTSVTENNRNLSPNMIVGGSKTSFPSIVSSSSTTNRALAETRRRSAALFQ